MAKRLAGRFGYLGENPFRVTFHWDRLDQPLRWRNPRLIFCGSMGDLFHKDVPYEFFAQIMEIVVRRPDHTFLFLTKRVKRMCQYIEFGKNEKFPEAWPPKNAWFGITVEDQTAADERIPYFLGGSMINRFISVEPMLSHISLTRIPLIPGYQANINALGGFLYTDQEGIHEPNFPDIRWVIAGGETGSGARPLAGEWVTDIRDSCIENETPFFFKQWGGKLKCHLIGGKEYREYPKGMKG